MLPGRGHSSQVELEKPLRHGGAFVARVRPVALGQLTRRRQGGEVDALEDLPVELQRLRALVREPEQQQAVGEALDSDADGPVPQVRVPALGHRVEVPVDDLVQIISYLLGDLEQLLEVKELPFFDVHVERDRGQVANRDLVSARELADLGAQVARLDRPQVLLVGVPVDGVLVHHVRRAGLALAFDDRRPQGLRLDGLPALPFPLVLLVQTFELLTVELAESRALVRAHQGPVSVLLDSLHEQVRHPEPVKQVPGALLLLAEVPLEQEELEDVGVPGLQVHREGALALAPALVHVPRRVVEDPEHGHEAVGVPVGASDVAAGGPHVVHADADAACALGDERALLQRLVDPFDAVLLDCEQEAGRHLVVGSAGVEQGGRGVGEPSLAHQLVSPQRAGQVPGVDAASDPHEHVLRPLHDVACDFEQVAALEGLEAEEIVGEVPREVDGLLQGFLVGSDEGVDLVADEGGWTAGYVLQLVQIGHDREEVLFGHLVQVGHHDAGSQLGVVRVDDVHVGAGLGGQVVEV